MRQIINKNQQQQTQAYYFNGRPIMFNKQSGYTFSDHSNMDATVEYFLSLDGFELVSGKKPSKPKQEVKKEEKVPKKESKGFFSKKKEAKKEEPKEEKKEE